MSIYRLLEEERHRRTEQMKMTALRAAIDEARREYAEGRGKPFDQAAVDNIAAAGRRTLTKHHRNDWRPLKPSHLQMADLLEARL